MLLDQKVTPLMGAHSLRHIIFDSNNIVSFRPGLAVARKGCGAVDDAPTMRNHLTLSFSGRAAREGHPQRMRSSIGSMACREQSKAPAVLFAERHPTCTPDTFAFAFVRR